MWCKPIINQCLTNINELHNKNTDVISQVFCENKIKLANILHNNNIYRKNKFNILQQITEMFNIINIYLPQLTDVNIINILIEKSYNQILVLYKEICLSVCFNPKSPEESLILKNCIHILQETEKTIIPLLPLHFPVKRIRNNCINYAKL